MVLLLVIIKKRGDDNLIIINHRSSSQKQPKPAAGSLETKKAAICKFFTLPENIRIQYDYGYSSVITIPYSVSKLVYTMLK